MQEKDFKLLFENVPGLYLILDPLFDIIAVSNAYLQATMTERDKILGRNIFDVFPDNPDDKNADGENNLKASLKRVLRNMIPDKMPIQKYDIRRPESEGGEFEERYWSPCNFPVFNNQKELVYIIHQVEDITNFVKSQKEKSEEVSEANRKLYNANTELKKLYDITKEWGVESLRKSEERYELATKALSVGIWDWDIVNQELYWSPAFQEIIYFSEEERPHHYEVWKERLHDEDRDEIIKMLDDHLKGLCPYSVEYRLRGNNGSYKWIKAIGQVVWDDHGNPTRMVGSVEDITWRKEAENQIKQDSIRLTTVMNTIIDGLIVIDDRGNIQSFNASAEKLFGYHPEEVIGKNVKMLMPEPYHSSHDGYLHNYNTTGIAKVIGIGREVTAKRKDGSIFPMELGINEMVVGNKKMFVGTIRDITERKRYETERDKLIAQLARSNSDLERFAYIASHDLQEPLRMVKSYTELLNDRLDKILDDKLRQMFFFVKNGAEHMQSLVTDILEYSKLGEEHEKYEDYSTEECLNMVKTNLENKISTTKAVITSDKLPALYGNKIRFLRVLQNLVGNGLKYQLPEITPEIHVGIKDDYDVNYWLFFVKDNGIGMKQEYCEQIFLPFKRLHNRFDYPGTGVGLSICRKIVESMGGRIWAESEEGKGSIFYFTVPKNPGGQNGKEF